MSPVLSIISIVIISIIVVSLKHLTEQSLSVTLILQFSTTHLLMLSLTVLLPIIKMSLFQ